VRFPLLSVVARRVVVWADGRAEAGPCMVPTLSSAMTLFCSSSHRQEKEGNPMRPGKKFAIAFLPTILIALAFVVTACGGGSGVNGPSNNATSKASADKQVYISPYAGLAKLKSIDPALAPDLYAAQADWMMFAGLVGLTDKGDVVPALATSWTP